MMETGGGERAPEAETAAGIESVHRLAMEIEDAAHERALAIERDAGVRAEALVAEAEAERERMWVELRALLAGGMAEVERLQSVRDRLTIDLSRIIGDSTDALRRLDRTAEDAAMPQDPVESAKRRPDPATLVQVDLKAGPFASFAEVLAFESELAALDEVNSVYVSRFTGGTVHASLGGRTREDMVNGIRGLGSIADLDETGDALSASLYRPEY